MKVAIKHLPQPKHFQPFALEVQVHSLEEAVALRALYGGVSANVLQAIVDGACKRPPSHGALEKVMTAIGSLVEEELREQGV